jgi:hypothetical protein
MKKLNVVPHASEYRRSKGKQKTEKYLIVVRRCDMKNDGKIKKEFFELKIKIFLNKFFLIRFFNIKSSRHIF